MRICRDDFTFSLLILTITVPRETVTVIHKLWIDCEQICSETLFLLESTDLKLLQQRDFKRALHRAADSETVFRTDFINKVFHVEHFASVILLINGCYFLIYLNKILLTNGCYNLKSNNNITLIHEENFICQADINSTSILCEEDIR